MNWTEALQRAVVNRDDTIPKGFRSSYELAAECGLVRRWFGKKADLLVKNNLAEKRYLIHKGRKTAFYKLLS